MEFNHFAFFEEQGFEQPSLLLETCYELTEIMHLQLCTYDVITSPG